MRIKIVVACVVLFVASWSPASAQSFEQLRKWCYGDGTEDQTIQGCDAIIRSTRPSPDQAAAFKNRGDAYLGKGQPDSAIRDYDQAIKLKPDDAEVFVYRGIAEDRKGQSDRSIQDYSQAIKLKPDYAAAFLRRCFIRAIGGQQLELALADCTESLRLDPNDTSALIPRGLTNLKLKRNSAAISDYSAWLNIYPDAASALFGRGIARLRNGDKTGGNADIAAAKKLKSTIADDFAKWGVTESLPSVQP